MNPLFPILGSASRWLNVGTDHEVVVDGQLAGETNFGGLVFELFIFDVVSGIDVSGNDFYLAGGAQPPASTV